MSVFVRLLRNFPYLVVAILAFALLVAIAFAHRYTPVGVSHLVNNVVHSLHGPGFAAVAVLIFTVLRLYRRGTDNYLHAAAAAMAVGIFAEATQIPGPRDAQFSDLVVNAVGIVGGLGVTALFDQSIWTGVRKRYRLGLSLMSIGALGISIAPAAWWSYASISQYRAIPILLSFESRWETSLIVPIRGRRPELIAAPSSWVDGGTIAHAEEADGRGMLIQFAPYPDWSDYSTLSFVAASAQDDSQEIVISVSDDRLAGENRSNRYSQRLVIGPEPKRYTIDLSKIRESTNKRPFSISHIKLFEMRATKPGSGTSLFIDNFRLELKSDPYASRMDKISSVFCCISATLARDSTLSRTTGSVFDIRILKRQSANSKL